MGIKGLSQWLKKMIPDVAKEVELKEFSGTRVAVDASVYLYKFISVSNTYNANWFDMFLNLIIWLRQNNIRPVFIFDGPPPKQKERTKHKRSVNKHKLEQKLLELDDILLEIEKIAHNIDLPTDLQTRVDNILVESTFDQPRKYIKRNLCDKRDKIDGQCIHVRPQDTQRIKNLLTYLGLPWFKAESEAEKMCSWLCFHKFVEAVITTDSDVLAYGAPIYLQNVRAKQDTCTLISHKQVIEALDMTPADFTDLCIMCGTDYNDNMPGIGPAKAYKLICEYGDLDNISQTQYDTSILYYEDARELFTLPPYSDFKIPRIKPIQYKNLELLLFKTNSRFSVENISKPLYHPEFTIAE